MSNNENDDDLISAEQFDDTAGFEEFQNKNTLGDLWRNNPLVKIGTLLAVLAVVVGGVILFGGKKPDMPPSQLSRANEVTEAPGSAPVSETYKQAVEEYNLQAVEQAISNRESALPVPTTPQLDRIPVVQEVQSEEDPLERWRMMQEERRRADQVQPAPQAPPVDTGRQQAVGNLAGAMSKQMEADLDVQKLQGPQRKSITSVEYLDRLAEEEQMAALAQAQDQQPEQLPLEILVPAGTIEYAQLITEATTDAPGPVLAEVVSGPLRGSRIIGAFQATDEYLVLNFNVVVVDGVSQPASAVALDPEDAKPGVITEVDNRYFKRVVLPAAAAFVEGLGDAISESGTTTITISGDTVSESEEDKSNDQEVASGVTEAGEKLADILDEEAERTRPLLRVAAGTPVGVLFLQPVIKN